MNDPVDDLMDRMARYIAPADLPKQEALRAAWRANPKVMDDFLFHAARGYDSERFAERLAWAYGRARLRRYGARRMSQRDALNPHIRQCWLPSTSLNAASVSLRMT
jgi:hypothetical protein